MSSPARSTTLAFALLLVIFGATASDPARPLSIGSPGDPRHDDLAAPWTWKLPPDRPAIPTATLASGAAKEILAAPALEEDSPWQLRYSLSGDLKAIAREEEGRITAEKGAVRRAGGGLVVAPRSGPQILCLNRRILPTKKREGEETRYVYGGRIGTGSLFRIETSFEHAAPGSYLVSSLDGRSIFVHEGSDHVTLSPDGTRILAFNALNPPAHARPRLGRRGRAGRRARLPRARERRRRAEGLARGRGFRPRRPRRHRYVCPRHRGAPGARGLGLARRHAGSEAPRRQLLLHSRAVPAAPRRAGGNPRSDPSTPEREKAEALKETDP